MADDETEFEFDLELDDYVTKAARALYEASEEHDPFTMYEMLPEEDRESLEAIAGVVIESILPDLTEALFKGISEQGE